MWLLDMFVGDAKALRVKAKDIKFVHAAAQRCHNDKVDDYVAMW